MNPIAHYLRLIALALVACHVSFVVAAEPKLPPKVRQYVNGWIKHDGDKVGDTVGEFGGYRDPSIFMSISGVDLADHVASFKGARFSLVRAQATAPDKLDLVWTITWPDARGTQQYVDHLALREGVIAAVESEGGPIPEALMPPIRDYFKYREAGDGDKVYALFGETGVLEAKTLPPGGIKGERLHRYFDRDKEWRFFMPEGARRQMTKDGRPTVEFQVNRMDGSLYVSGREVFTIEGDRIVRLRGLF